MKTTMDTIATEASKAAKATEDNTTTATIYPTWTLFWLSLTQPLELIPEGKPTHNQQFLITNNVLSLTQLLATDIRK